MTEQTITAAQDAAGRQRVRTAMQRAVARIADELTVEQDNDRYIAYYEAAAQEVDHFRRLVADWDEGSTERESTL